MRSGFFHWEMMWKATLGVEGGREERERTKRERERGWKRSYKRCAIYLSIYRSSQKGPQKSESIEIVHPAHDVGLAVTAAGGLVPGASFVPEPSERLQMTSLRCLEGGVLVPSAPLPPQVLEHPQVTSTSGDSAGLEFFHRAPFVPGPLQAFQMTELGCQLTCEVTPQASLTLSPLQAFQVTFLSGPVACVFIPRAALAPEPLQDLKVTTVAGTENEGAIQLEPLLSFQPLQDLQMASFRCKAKSKQETSQKRKQRRRRRNCEDEDSPASLATSKNTPLVISGSDVFKGLRSSCSKGRWP